MKVVAAVEFNKVKEQGIQALYPGKQLSDFDVNKLAISVLSSGFKGLDDFKMLKKDRGELILLGARPSQGKSGLGFQIATQVAEHSKVHIFSLEMDHESIVSRQASIALDKPLDYIQRGLAPADELDAVKARLARLNCIVDDEPGLNIHQICSRARDIHSVSKTSLIVVDYIQIIAHNRGNNIAAELGEISAGLKALAKELRIPVIALSQLNRNSELREDGTPQLADLKGSGSLEQDADVVLLLHRPEDTPSTAIINVAKNRNGPTGEVELYFAAGQCRFLELTKTPKTILRKVVDNQDSLD